MNDLPDPGKIARGERLVFDETAAKERLKKGGKELVLPKVPPAVADALKNRKSVGESASCVSLVKALAGLGEAKTWTPGDKVMGNGKLPAFTPVATFFGAEYPNYPTGNHAALVVRVTDNGIFVFDQFTGRTPGYRFISSMGGMDDPVNKENIEKGKKEADALKDKYNWDIETPGENRTKYYTTMFKYYKPSRDADNFSVIRTD